MINIKRYNSELKKEWDEFVQNSKNATFLIKRDFMDYHSDRFADHSLLFYDENKLIGLLPANIKDKTLYSHEGLTYGGIIMSIKTTTTVVLDIFEALIIYLKEQNIEKLIYKVIPYVYHNQASEEDLYALFRNDAKLLHRGISTCVFMQNRIKFSRLRKRSMDKAIASNVQIKETTDFSRFWELLNFNLEDRHQVKPVHTFEEIEYLRSKFPKEIRLFYSFNNEHDILAGALVFEMQNIVHVQYISSNPVGRSMGAVDIILDHLYTNIYADKTYFDFGISTEDGGRFLNEGLIRQKEGFGGRGIVYDIYELTIN